MSTTTQSSSAPCKSNTKEKMSNKSSQSSASKKTAYTPPDKKRKFDASGLSNVYREPKTNKDDAKYSYEIPYINVELKKHQQTSLAKMIVMEEKKEWIHTLSQRSYKGNLGILNDPVGKGKTLTCLSLIAHPHEIHQIPVIPSTWTNNTGCIYFSYEETKVPEPNLINSTLIVVPFGQIFKQWVDTIVNMTDLSFFKISTMKHLAEWYELKEPFSRKIVLVCSTMYNAFMTKDHCSMSLWRRLIIDEASTIKIPNMLACRAMFTWFVTATPEMLNEKRCRGFISDIFCDRSNSGVNQYMMRHIKVYNDDKYVEESMGVVPFKTVIHIARQIVDIGALRGNVSSLLIDALNADDLPTAIEQVGGKAGSTDDIIELVTKDLTRNIKNLEIEMESVLRLDLPQFVKQQRLNSIMASVQNLTNKKKSIEERLKSTNDNCGICTDQMTNVLTLACSHMFCAGCIIEWMQHSCKNGGVCKCPTCRSNIIASQLMLRVEANEVKLPSDKKTLALTKLQLVNKLISDKPTGKFVIFSSHEYAFEKIKVELDKSKISNKSVKGNSMVNTVEEFQHGKLQVVMLNSKFNAAGINLDSATDIILFNALDKQTETQVIGRGQRFGRKTVLNVHKLCYDNELQLH